MALKAFCSIFAVLAFIAVQSVMSLEIVSRSGWNALPPKRVTPVKEKMSFVIIHHSATGSCTTGDSSCPKLLQSIQKYHQNNQHWDDIGYHFAIGGDGKVYECRGFNVVGAHAPNYNKNGLGIVFLGDFQTELPSKKMLQAAQELISHAVRKGFIQSNYVLYGHKQVSDTICPGPALFNEIKKWPHFKNKA